MSERIPTWALVLLVAALSVVAAVLWTRPSPRAVHAATPVPAGPFEPCLVDTMPLGRELRLSGPSTHVPEANDCQAFVDQQGNYGPVFGIFVRHQLARMASPALRRAAAVALIHAGGDYQPLGLKAGFNCLLMYRRGPATVDLGAIMEPVRSEQDCFPDVPLSDLRSATRLEAHYRSSPAYTNDDYPEVARWDRDSVGMYYIDIRCGEAYCEVGPAGLKPLAPVPTPAAAQTAAERRVYDIKLWYDDQPLGSAGIHGYVFPDAGINARVDPHAMQHAGDPWLASAMILLVGGDYPPLNLTSGTNDVALCHGAEQDCIPPHEIAQVTFGDARCPADGQDWLRVRSASGQVRYYCARAMDHGTTHVPGTARWHWWPAGESVWIKCPGGSCTPR